MSHFQTVQAVVIYLNKLFEFSDLLRSMLLTHLLKKCEDRHQNIQNNRH